MANSYADVQKFQSTHPHRVRHTHPAFLWCIFCFNPRTHIGCDCNWRYWRQKVLLFQSTHPHRVRLGVQATCCIVSLFQSTHPHRVRQVVEIICFDIASFNPRTHIGCDIFLDSSSLFICSFNPRTHIGCDQDFLAVIPLVFVFQSTHPHRVRLPKGIL